MSHYSCWFITTFNSFAFVIFTQALWQSPSEPSPSQQVPANQGSVPSWIFTSFPLPPCKKKIRYPGLSKSTPLRPGRDFTSYVTRYGFACVRVAVCLRDLCTNSLALQDYERQCRTRWRVGDIPTVCDDRLYFYKWHDETTRTKLTLDYSHTR